MLIGIDSGYDDFLDPRTWSIQAAVWFCEMAGIQGISARADDLIRDTTQIPLVKSKVRIEGISARADDLIRDTTQIPLVKSKVRH